jgi:hypothetical protein
VRGTIRFAEFGMGFAMGRGVRMGQLRVLRGAGVDASRTAEPGPQGWTAGVEGTPLSTEPMLDRPHPDPTVRDRFARPGAFAIGAILWNPPDADANDAAADAALGWARPSVSLTVERHLGWWNDDPVDDPTDVVRQVSFLAASPGYDQGAFREHYRHHVEIARRHMPSLWRYVQNDVVAAEGPDAEAADGIVAVSELWFRTSDDFLNRYFASAADAEEFRSHEGFLDLSRAFSFIAERCLPADRATRG